MTNQSRELRTEASVLAKAYQDIAVKAATEKREYTAEEKTAQEKRMADFLAAKNKFEELDKAEDMNKIITDVDTRSFKAAAEASAEDRGVEKGTITGSTSEKKPQFLRSYLARGKDGLSDAEKRAFGISAANVGDVMVPTEVYNQIFVAMRPYGWWVDKAQVITTDGGYPLVLPTFNDTATNATIVADGGSISADSSTPFSSFTLNAYKFVSGQIAVSYELLADSAIDVDALVATMIAQRFGRAFSNYTTVGTGSSQPKGIVPAATAWQTAITGKSGAPQYADIVTLMFKVNALYRNNPAAAFLANDATIAGMFSLVDANNRPLVNFNGFGSALPMTILGYPLISTWDMPTAATSAKSLLFGDLSQFKIRFANQMTLVRQVEALATTGQVGFVATWRMDSNLADAGTHPVYVFQGAAT